MKQCHLIPLILINAHHISPLSPIKIWNPWNLRFQAFPTLIRDTLEAEKTNLPPGQQLILCEAHIQDKSWLRTLTLVLMENLVRGATCFSEVLLFLKALFRMSPTVSYLLLLSPGASQNISSFPYLHFSNIRRAFHSDAVTYDILCPREGYLTFLNFSLFIGKMGIVLFALLVYWKTEMQLCANSVYKIVL